MSGYVAGIIGAEQILQQGENVGLARVMPRGAGGQVAARDFAGAHRFPSAAIKGQRKTAKHRGHDPSRVTLIQQQAGSLPLCLTDRAAARLNFIDQSARDRVRFHGHFRSSMGLGCTSHGGKRTGVLQPRSVSAFWGCDGGF